MEDRFLAVAARHATDPHDPASLERHLPEDFTWSRPEGGMFVWIQGPQGFDAVELQNRVIERGVAFVPGRFR